MNPRAILALVKSIIAEQREGSDYDALYFGMQDIEEMLIDLTRGATHRTARVRGHGDSVYVKKKRKPSAYNNFVAQKAKLPRFKYKSSRGKKKKGMTNMKAIGVAWRKLSKNQQAKYK